MKHVHKQSGMTFECGELIDRGANATYDMTVITYWPSGYEPPVIVGYYFGEYDPEATDFYIDEWFATSFKNNAWIDVLFDAHDIVDAYRITNEGVLDEATSERVARVLSVLNRTLQRELED